jgi:hypothetical protein
LLPIECLSESSQRTQYSQGTMKKVMAANARITKRNVPIRNFIFRARCQGAIFPGVSLDGSPPANPSKSPPSNMML